MDDFKEKVNQAIESRSSGGIGVVGALGVAFVILKLLGEITWSWWLVTLPFWGGFALVIGIAIIAIFFVLLIDGIRAIFRKR